MLDLSSRWSLLSGTGFPGFALGGIHMAQCAQWHQALVSGNAAAASEALGLRDRPAGAFEIVSGPLYAVAIARDRLLVVSETPFTHSEGWHSSGFAFTRMSDGYAIFDISGERLEDLKNRAANPSLVTGSRSARIDFAARGCLAYHYKSPDLLRIHIDRAYADYLLAWIERSVR